MKHFYRSIIAAAGVLSLSVGCNEAIGCRHYRSTISSESSDSGEEICQNWHEYSDDSLTSDDEIENPRARDHSPADRHIAPVQQRSPLIEGLRQISELFKGDAKSSFQKEDLSEMKVAARWLAYHSQSESIKDLVKLLYQERDEAVNAQRYAVLYNKFWKGNKDFVFWDRNTNQIRIGTNCISPDDPDWKDFGCSLILINLARSYQDISLYDPEYCKKMLKRLLKTWFLPDEPGEDLYKMYETSVLYINSAEVLQRRGINGDIVADEMEINDTYRNWFKECDKKSRRKLRQFGAFDISQREYKKEAPFHWSVESLAKSYSGHIGGIYKAFCEENKNFKPLQFNGGDFVEFFNKLDNGVKSAFEEYINPLEYKRWEKEKNKYLDDISHTKEIKVKQGTPDTKGGPDKPAKKDSTPVYETLIEGSFKSSMRKFNNAEKAKAGVLLLVKKGHVPGVKLDKDGNLDNADAQKLLEDLVAEAKEVLKKKK